MVAVKCGDDVRSTRVTRLAVGRFLRTFALHPRATMDIAAPDQADYPRPHLRRKQWLSLNGMWRFTFDDELRFRIPTAAATWPQQIKVPFAPESNSSGVHGMSGISNCVKLN